MNFYSYGIQIGPLLIHYYSLCVLSGILIGTWFFSQFGKQRGFAPETAWESLYWFALSGLIGARLWHILFPSASSGITFTYYLRHPLQMLKVWEGGLGIPGAIVGACMGIFLFCRKYQFQYGHMLDSMAPALALGQAIGRWGNYFNQELYGSPSNLPWAIHIDPAYRLPAYQSIATYHPLFLYEMIYNLLNMGILLWINANFFTKLKSGDLFLCYLVIYPIGRFFLEFLRLDPATIGSLNMNQLIMLITAIVSCIFLAVRHMTLRLTKSKK